MSHEETEKVSVLTERIDHLIERLDKFEEMAEERFVTRVEFSPVQKVVYGGVALVLASALGAVLSLVFIHVK